MARTEHRSFITHILFPIFVILILLAACAPTGPAAPTGSSTEPVAETALTAVLPTDTAEPQLPSAAWLVASPEADAAQLESVRAALNSLAAQSGLTVEERQAIQTGEITENIKVLVFLTVPANLNELVASAPNSQFIVASPSDLSQAPNLSVIRIRPEHIAFTAGYISVITASDMRSAGLLPSDTPLGANLAEIYVNGGRFFCGLCNPYYAPLVKFPLAVAQPGATDFATWQAAGADLLNYYVYVVYVSPELSTPDLLNDLAAKGFFLLGGITPPAEVQPRWIVTIQPDLAAPLEELWADASAGTGGRVVNAGIRFSNINAEIFTPGKQDMVQRMVDDLQAGLIGVEPVPLQ